MSESRTNHSALSAPDVNLYEYAVIRYVPRVEREEFINIGLIMMCNRADDGGNSNSYRRLRVVRAFPSPLILTSSSSAGSSAVCPAVSVSDPPW